MKYGLTLLSIALFLGQFNAQTIINGDFETWNEAPQFEVLDGWSSSNDEFGNGETMEVTDSDAFDGSHAVLLQNHLVDDETQFGFALYGEFGDEGPESGFPFEGTIDGMSAQIQYDIQEMDTAIALLVGFHEGSIVEMAVAKIIGTATDWVELNVDFTGATLVDQVAVAFASTNALEDEFVSIVGSSLLVDNVQLTFEGTDLDVVPNGSFEDWDVVALELLEDWNYFVHPDFPLVEKTEDAYAGNFAVKLENLYNDNDDETALAILTNGEITMDGIEGGQEISDRPSTFMGRYKYNSAESDQAFIQAQFLLEGEIIGIAVAELMPNSDYTLFSVPVNFETSEIPDHVQIATTPGNNVGSILILDNLSFDNALSIDEEITSDDIEFNIYPNPVVDFVTFSLAGEHITVESLSVYDVSSKMVLGFDPSYLEQNNKTMQVDLSSLNAGTYIFVLNTNIGSVTETVVKK